MMANSPRTKRSAARTLRTPSLLPRSWRMSPTIAARGPFANGRPGDGPFEPAEVLKRLGAI